MKYRPISNQIFTINRKNFVSRLMPHSLAIFHSNDEFPRNGDQNFLFKQNPDFFYLFVLILQFLEQCLVIISNIITIFEKNHN